jgi:hypothetical protein
MKTIHEDEGYETAGNNGQLNKLRETVERQQRALQVTFLKNALHLKTPQND